MSVDDVASDGDICQALPGSSGCRGGSESAPSCRIGSGTRSTGSATICTRTPSQGLTLVHFSAQPEPFLTPKHTQNTA